MDSLAGVPVLICFGLMGEVRARIGLDYMGAQARWLRTQGAHVTRLDLPTSAPVAANAAKIAAFLRRHPDPPLVLSHSKGGLEAVAALIDPDLPCRGLVALQSPFWGSPVADALAGRQPMRLAAGAALQLLGTGSGAGLDDLTTAARAGWMRDHAEAVAALTARLPVLVVATTVDAAHALAGDRPYLWMARWLEAQGAGPNDGLVPIASASLPGARQMHLAGSHVALVCEGAGRDPVGVLRGLLAGL